MSLTTALLFVGSWGWLFASFYLTIHRDRYPQVVASAFAWFALVGFLSSARILNEGDPIQIVFILADMAIFLFAIGAPLLLVAVVRSYPSSDPDDGNLP